ncbi:MAG: MoxR family ATPase, partial [Desulfobacterales bacterium]
AQKDRFMLKINMDPPGKAEELTLAQRMLGKDAPEETLASGAVKQIITEELITKLRAAMAGILVKEDLVAYVVDIVRKSREHQSILVGAGPRATQALLLSSRAFAAISGRDFVTPDDIKQMVYAVLEHRLILRPEYEIEGLTVKEVIENILKGIAVPR